MLLVTCGYDERFLEPVDICGRIGADHTADLGPLEYRAWRLIWLSCTRILLYVWLIICSLHPTLEHPTLSCHKTRNCQCDNCWSLVILSNAGKLGDGGVLPGYPDCKTWRLHIDYITISSGGQAGKLPSPRRRRTNIQHRNCTRKTNLQTQIAAYDVVTSWH